MTFESHRFQELARRLAVATGEDVEIAVERAIQERLSRMADRSQPNDRQALQRFFEVVSGLPIHDHRTPEEIVGFDDRGLPV